MEQRLWRHGFEWRHLCAHEIDHEKVWSGIFALGLALAVAVPAHVRVALFCPFKRLTGLPCPTCGSGRVISAFLSLAPRDAFQMNPLVAVVFVAWALFSVYAAVVILFRLPRLRATTRARWTRWPLVAVAIGAVAANWLYLVFVGI